MILVYQYICKLVFVTLVAQFAYEFAAPTFLRGPICLEPMVTNEQPGDPSASLLLTSEKAVSCNCTSDSLLTDCYWALNGLLLAFEDTNLIIDEYMGNFWSCDDCEDVHI